MSERLNMRGDPGLSLGPSLLYPAKAFATRGRSLLWAARGRRTPGLRILFYHRVSRDRDELAVTPEAFASQMDAVARAGLRAVGLVELVELLRAGRGDEPVVGLSFDDAYADVAEHAVPVLQKHGYGATVFVATGVTDGRASFSWYEQQPPLIGWDEMVRLDGGPLHFEPHTVTHPNLLALSDDDLRRELADSKRELEERLGRPTSVFCYPAGLFGARERRAVVDAGFTAAASCEPGANTPETDLFALRRIQVDARDRVLDVRAKLAGAHDTPLPLRAAWRSLRYGQRSRL